ncbi:MAG: hypothetical protein SVG88_02930 [Halobacteriales archaeon]|nr:hypothetical protein [Halobacteriales archaeon]
MSPRRPPSFRTTRLLSIGRRLLFASVIIAGLAIPVRAHVGALGGAARTTTVPSWLTIITGGGVVGASFLFASFMTDHETIQAINRREFALSLPTSLAGGVVGLARIVGVLGLGLVLLSGLFGPRSALLNFAILVVWAGWWAGYTMSIYLVGNTWPAINPWRTIAQYLPRVGEFTYPERLGVWPSVVGLLGLVWFEVVSPVATAPRLLASAIIAYTVATLLGAAIYGPDVWFDRVDPVSKVFRWYGRLAPIQRTDDGLSWSLPGSTLVSDVSIKREHVPFVIALLWATTYDGLVSTSAWAAVARLVVGLGVPALLVYLLGIAAGFWLFLTLYRVAARWARGTADTYVTADAIERRFIPSLLPIAAGYHLAHFLGYFLGLSTVLIGVLPHPLGGAPPPRALVLPDWFGSLGLVFVVGGHLLAIWLSHAIAFDFLPGRLQPIRSQYPFIVIMIFYTIVSMWIVAQPYNSPPFVAG